MSVIRCKACGCVYDYNKQGMCPKCGAYNRPPRRERVDPDGSVHFVESHDAAVPSHRGKKVCYEQKTCYEGQTRRSARKAAGEPDNIRAKDWENLKDSAQGLKNKFQNMEKKRRDTLVGCAAALLVLIIPFLRACISSSTSYISRPEPEPAYPTEEAAVQYAGDTTVYQMDWYFDLMGETGQVAEVQTDGQRVIVTVEGLTSDTAPLPFLTAYDAGGNLLDLTAPIQFTMLDYGTEYIFDRSMYNAEDAAEWLLEFDVQEEQDGTMVYTGDVVAVDLTDALP